MNFSDLFKIEMKKFKEKEMKNINKERLNEIRKLILTHKDNQERLGIVILA